MLASSATVRVAEHLLKLYRKPRQFGSRQLPGFRLGEPATQPAEMQGQQGEAVTGE
jgi:hypothetical protein